MDIITQAILSNKINSVVSGVESVTVDDTTLNFVFTDGEEASITFPSPIDGKDVTVVEDESNNDESYKLKITNGDHVFITPNLKGNGAISPIANVVKQGSKTTITITDSNGTTTSDILDGQNTIGSDETTNKTILIIGDSAMVSTEFNGGAFSALLSKDYPTSTVINKSVGGTLLTTDEIYTQLTTAYSEGINPDIIIMTGGGNDIIAGKSLGNITEYYDSILDTTTVCGALEKLVRYVVSKVTPKLYYVGLWKLPQGQEFCGLTLPTLENQKNSWDILQKLCQKYGVGFVDMFSHSNMNLNIEEQFNTYTLDGVHINLDGYTRIYPILKATLNGAVSGGTSIANNSTSSFMTDEELAQAIEDFYASHEDSLLTPNQVKEKYVPYINDTDTNYWQDLEDNQSTDVNYKRYGYGIAYSSPTNDYSGSYENTPKPTHIQNNEVVHGMLQVVADKMSRWQYDNGNGGHLLELWDKAGKQRFTGMIQPKENDKLPLFALQMWDVDRNDFGWIRLGSDNFRDDITPSGYGGIAITGTFGKNGVPWLNYLMDEPVGMPDYTTEGCQLNNTTQEIKDGTFFIGNDGIPRLRINGTWKKFMLEEEGEHCTFTLEKTRLGDLMTIINSLNSSDYYTGSWNKVSSAMSEANSVYNISEKQSDYGDVWRMLNRAYNSLCKNTIYENAEFYCDVDESIFSQNLITSNSYIVVSKEYPGYKLWSSSTVPTIFNSGYTPALMFNSAPDVYTYSNNVWIKISNNSTSFNNYSLVYANCDIKDKNNSNNICFSANYDQSKYMLPINLTSLEISGETTVEEGSVISLSVAKTPTDANTYNLVWSSSNENVVVNNGTVTGITAGTSVVTSTDTTTNISDSIEITVTELEVPEGSVTFNGTQYGFTSNFVITDGNPYFTAFKWGEDEICVTYSDVLGYISGQFRNITTYAYNLYKYINNVWTFDKAYSIGSTQGVIAWGINETDIYTNKDLMRYTDGTTVSFKANI